MTNKMTKKDKFAMVMEIVANADVDNKAEMMEFLNHEIELLEKKSSKSGQTKTQKENELLKADLLKAFEVMDRPVTVSEFMDKSSAPVASLTNQKISALLNQLVKSGAMVKIIEKKRSYFALV